MKSIYLTIVTVIFSLIMISCDSYDDYQLSETVFIDDPYFPGLPIYSEWGYNTFGAYIDRKPFVSTSDDLPSKIIIQKDTLRLILRGRMRNQDVDLTFSFAGYSYKQHAGLLDLHDVTIDLKASGNSAKIKMGHQPEENLGIINGTMHIKRAQHLYLDEQPVRIILSGVFQFQTLYNDEPIAISNGRFDLGYGYENFFNLDQ